ncbi:MULTISPECIES: hypothetical protein [unclassified Acinetobacter]|uniref:hypothetical protein n=1 Tax=unclassified Acinetobacter TaxID=196816 RepID=UPI0020374973|nr:hypothetical protein [Acinetobacter sp. C32I]USA52620.1 hypothetical protein NDN13_14260 [Acinetobacter sp. C32I]
MNFSYKEYKLAIWGITFTVVLIAALIAYKHKLQTELVESIAKDLLVEQSQIPFNVNSTVKLINIKQDKLHVTYTYQTFNHTADEVDLDDAKNNLIPENQAYNCTYLKNYIKNGIVVDYIYIDKNGKKLFTNTLNKKSCNI